MSSQSQSQTSPLPFDTGTDALDALAADLLRRSAPVDAGAFDELRQRDGGLRDAWRRFLSWLPEHEGLSGLDRGVQLVGQQIRADGITHNVYGEQGHSSVRPWSLELLPMLIEPGDWAGIEAGVIQRAELLNLMLADLYGPRQLLKESLLPPALLFRHSGYLRPLHGVRPPGGMHLHIVAFDLARSPDGRWWTMAQRTQGPSGLGYVLHNRLIVSRLFPDAFREMRVQHIASSYRRLLDTVEVLARECMQRTGGSGQPRIVLLTSGPHNETYFEHAYLARYLGLPLVEGGDLLVRGDRLFLKTVEGLEPVHGLLRRLDDDFCDPLELRPDSRLGVPGLLMAVRAGTVVMANALGSGFLESPAIQGFLPAISQRLLGQPLIMPSLPSWWCGEQAAWDGVRDSLGERLIRHTFPRRGDEPALTAPDVPEPAAWTQRIEADPEAWTVQGRLELAHTPLWQRGRVTPKPAVLRVYAIADGFGRWHVLPGGMTRVATKAAHDVSMQHGGSSLDTWVMTDGAVDTFSMLPTRLGVDDIVARQRPVSSRTAENLFWLGRYTERTEQQVRLARTTLSLIDADADAPGVVLEALSELAVRGGLVSASVPSLTRSPHVFERAVLAALGDPAATSIAFNLEALAHSTGALRDRLSPEYWSLVRSMADDFGAQLRDVPAGTVPTVPQVLPLLDRLGLQLAALTGVQSDRMTRDHGWRLLTVGRFIERLVSVSAQLGSLLDAGALSSAAGIDLLLDLFDSTITFRARYQRHQDLLALTDTLVLDTSNPRAWGCVVRRLRNECAKLPGTPASIDELLALLPRDGVGITLDDLRSLNETELAARLSALAERLNEAGANLSDEIGRRFFAHADGINLLQRV